MYYFESNSIIYLAKADTVLSAKQRQKCYTSILVIQELIKNLSSQKEDGIAFRVRTLQWIEKNEVSIHWKSYNERFASAFKIEVEYPLSKGVRLFYYDLIESDYGQYEKIIEKYSDVLKANDLLFSSFNKDLLEDSNSFADERLRSLGVKRGGFQRFIDKQKSKEETEKFMQKQRIKLEDYFVKAAFLTTMKLVESPPPEKDWQLFLKRYDYSLNAYAKVLANFNMSHFLFKHIKKNDIIDCIHIVYLYDRKFKMITEDKKLKKIIRETLGNRYAVSIDWFLEKFQ